MDILPGNLSAGGDNKVQSIFDTEFPNESDASYKDTLSQELCGLSLISTDNICLQ